MYGFIINLQNKIKVNGEGRNIFKNPVTDDGTKKSATGLLQVFHDSFNDNKLTLMDKCSWEEESSGLLKTVFKDGKLIKDYTLSEVRNNLLNS